MVRGDGAPKERLGNLERSPATPWANESEEGSSLAVRTPGFSWNTALGPLGSLYGSEPRLGLGGPASSFFSRCPR